MGFIPHSYDDSYGRSAERLPVTGSLAISVGTGLVVTAGKLALATGTTKPTYISLTERASTVDGEKIEVQRVGPDVIFETELSEAAASLAIGAKQTIDTTGNKITSTTTSGVAEVINFDGTAAGDKVRVRFA